MEKQVWKEPLAFLAATFGTTWLLWLGAYAISFPPSAQYVSSTQLIMLGTAAPSAMGLLFTYVSGRGVRLRELLRSMLRFRAPLMWWLYTALLFPVILLCSSAIFSFMGGQLSPPQFPVWFLPFAFLYIFACMGPLGEELGWRGFLLKQMLSQWGRVKAGLVLGFIWSAWHLPLFFIPGTIQRELSGIGLGLALIGYLFYTSCISLLITVLYAETGGNLLLCMVFHTVCNLSLGMSPIILTKGGAAVLLIFLAFATVCVIKSSAGRRFASGPGRQDQQHEGPEGL